MCGIAGVVRTDGGMADRSAIERMVRSLRHRGPDAMNCSSYGTGSALLGHTRLAIIDLSTGNQPMSSADGNIGLVFNGEIYNYLELRDQLSSMGRSFQTQSDTEVILQLYEHAGPGAITRLRGMFAFAIYDHGARRLILARDRVGKKPLYYMELGGAIVFASELKAIIAYLGTAPDVDWSFLADYFSLGYIPQPHTPFRQIRKLEAGNYLILEDGKIQIKSYWRVPRFEPLDIQEAEAKERVAAAMKEAVAIRLRSDVPFGALLSGGIDSSLVTALMVGSGKLIEQARTFSVGFKGSDHNELPTADRIASHLGTVHDDQMLEIDVAAVLPKISWHMDEPFADSSAVPTWYVASMAASKVKMVLSGDGGDELFCGYERYNRLRQIAAIRERPLISGALSIIGGLIPRSSTGLPGKLRRLTGYLRQPEDIVYTQLVGILSRDDLDAMGISPHSSYPPAVISQAWSGGSTILDRAMYTDIHSYLLEDVLVKVDRMAMAHALEVRSPLLDHELLQLAASIPLGFKRKGNFGKVILRSLASQMLPAEILKLPKHGFSAPVDEWYRGGALRQPLEEEIEEGEDVIGHLCPAAIQLLLRDVDHGVPASGEKLFALHTLLLWYRLFVKNPQSSFDVNPSSAEHAPIHWVTLQH